MCKEHASSCQEAPIPVPTGTWTREESKVAHGFLSGTDSLQLVGIVFGYRVTTLTHHLG